MKVLLATADHEIQSCYPVMSELRPHVAAEEFLPRVKRQTEIAGYKLAYFSDGEVKAVAAECCCFTIVRTSRSY